MKGFHTPQKDLPIAGWGRVSASVLIDLFILGLTLSWILAIAKRAGAPVPEWFSAVAGVLAFSFAWGAYRGWVRSLGGWALGLKRVAGSEESFALEQLPNSVLSRRTIILTAYLVLILSTALLL